MLLCYADSNTVHWETFALDIFWVNFLCIKNLLTEMPTKLFLRAHTRVVQVLVGGWPVQHYQTQVYTRLTFHIFPS